MVEGINGNQFQSNYNIKLQNRGKQPTGLTYEMKSLFSQLEKQGLIKDTKGDGFSKADAQNLFASLNKLHQDTSRSTNYTGMRDGQSFDYTKDEILALAKAAGYETVSQAGTPKNSPVVETPEITTTDPTEDNENEQETVLETATETLPKGTRILEREVDGQKQRIAVYKENGKTVRKLLDENNHTIDDLVIKSNPLFGKKTFVSKTELAKQVVGLTADQELPQGVEVGLAGDIPIFRKDGKTLTPQQVKQLADGQGASQTQSTSATQSINTRMQTIATELQDRLGDGAKVELVSTPQTTQTPDEVVQNELLTRIQQDVKAELPDGYSVEIENGKIIVKNENGQIDNEITNEINEAIQSNDLDDISVEDGISEIFAQFDDGDNVLKQNEYNELITYLLEDSGFQIDSKNQSQIKSLIQDSYNKMNTDGEDGISKAELEENLYQTLANIDKALEQIQTQAPEATQQLTNEQKAQNEKMANAALKFADENPNFGNKDGSMSFNEYSRFMNAMFVQNGVDISNQDAIANILQSSYARMDTDGIKGLSKEELTAQFAQTYEKVMQDLLREQNKTE